MDIIIREIIHKKYHQNIFHLRKLVRREVRELTFQRSLAPGKFPEEPLDEVDGRVGQHGRHHKRQPHATC